MSHKTMLQSSIPIVVEALFQTYYSFVILCFREENNRIPQPMGTKAPRRVFRFKFVLKFVLVISGKELLLLGFANIFSNSQI